MSSSPFNRQCLRNASTSNWYALPSGVPIRLAAEQVEALFKAVAANPGYKLSIDLERQTIGTPDGKAYQFEVEAFRKHCLLNGLDDIGLTLQHVDEIKAYEAKHRSAEPWLFA